MATIWANATKVGASTANFVVTRGVTQTGDVTVAYDSTKVTTKAQLQAAASLIIRSLQDQLK